MPIFLHDIEMISNESKKFDSLVLFLFYLEIILPESIFQKIEYKCKLHLNELKSQIEHHYNDINDFYHDFSNMVGLTKNLLAKIPLKPGVSMDYANEKLYQLFKNPIAVDYIPKHKGIPKYLLDEIFDLSILFPCDLPGHCIIPLNAKILSYYIEELEFLEDIVFYYHMGFVLYSDIQLRPDSVTDDRIKLTVRYFKQTIIISPSFLECFINSVGFNYINNNRSRVPENELNCLEQKDYYPLLSNNNITKKPKKCTSLEDKYFNYSRIISKIYNNPNLDGIKNDINWKNFQKSKNIRDSLIHHSKLPYLGKNKEEIFLDLDYWYDYANKSYYSSLFLAKNFWQICHVDNSSTPLYLHNLDDNMLTYNFFCSYDDIIEILKNPCPELDS
jgi:hypothetical protein